MNAAILTIGDEIVEGARLDTNSHWIAKRIINYGLVTDLILSVRDNEEKICSVIKGLVNKYDFIFITGGLGPTHDDITISSFQKLFNLKSSIDSNYEEKIAQKFSDRNMEMPEINKNQAIVLNGTSILDNPIGTARGIYYKDSKSNFFIMPGVPDEMYKMMDEIIIPSYLGSAININHRIIRVSGIAESKLAVKVEKLIQVYSNKFSFSFLPSYRGVDFVIKAHDLNEEIDKVSDEFYNQMKPYSFGYGNDSFLEFIINELSKRKLNISIAESCTGGLLGKMLTDTPGSSEVFIGGIIAYNNSVKINQLKVSKNMIDQHGAVSSEVSIEMAQNIKKIFNSDIGISITGIAGPSGDSKNKNIGLVFIAIAFKNQCIFRRFNFNLSRDLNRKTSCYAALNIIRKMIQNEY